MAGNALNICVGPATLSINGTDVGYTKGGVSIRMPRSYLEIVADQAMGVVKIAKTLEQMMVKTTLLEATLANLRWAWDQAAESAIGVADAVCNEVALVVVGVAPSGGTRTFTLTKCVPQGDSEVVYSREAETGLEVEFQCLKASTGAFGTLADS